MNTQSIPGVLHAVAPFFVNYGYVTVFVALAVISVVVPGEIILTAAALYASFGKLNIVYIIIIGITAATLGSNIGYMIGYFKGNHLIIKYGNFIFFNERRFNKAQKFFKEHGGKVMMVAPFIEGQTIAVIAGTSHMPWRIFFIFSFTGIVIWVGAWTALGYLFGSYITVVYATVRHYMFLGLVVVVLAIGLLALKKLFRSWSRY